MSSTHPVPASIDTITGQKRLELAHFPTPLEAAPRLAAHAGLAELFIKREDMSGYALGGNKLRQIDFILAEALDQGADMVITTAGSQSNFCRSLAGAAAKLGLGCHLHLRAKMGTDHVGNLLLDDIFGAKVTFTEKTDPWDPAIRAELDEIGQSYEAAGRKPYIAQLTGSSATLGIAGWVSGAAELMDDFRKIGRQPDAIVVVCGSGLTAGGLALGLKHLGATTRVVGVSAQQPEARLRQWIVETANAATTELGFATRLAPNDFDILDDKIGPGYGIPSPASIEAVRQAGRLAGLVLDPVYTGKGMAALLAEGDGGMLTGKSVVFLHSGGTPGLFTHAAAFDTDARP
ncbi:pyridoxal-phosphate dependent enzyme [Devosia ginsengisoli]|nr:pyridoxal-phosphate dependent enzyme [Devosia ginsengisoli]